MVAGLTDHVWALDEWLTYSAVQRQVGHHHRIQPEEFSEQEGASALLLLPRWRKFLLSLSRNVVAIDR